MGVRIEDSIETVRELADSLIKISKIRKIKYPFREIYLKKLIDRYETVDSRYEIHLFDLTDDTIVDFNKIPNEKLCRLIGRKGNGFEIKTLRKIKNLLVNLDELEKNVICIRTRGSKPFRINGLPIRLNEDNWAYVYGSLPDAGIRRFDFYSENKPSLIEIKKRLSDLGCQYSEFHNRIVANKMFTRILSLSGIDINRRQNKGNNALPPWIFAYTSNKFKEILVTKFFESEGYLSKDSSQAAITQTNNIQLIESDFIKIKDISKEYIIKASGTKIMKVNYNKLSDDMKATVMNNPCLILISLQLLLKKLGINSFINPEYLYIDSGNDTNIMWNLRIFGSDLNRFVEICSHYVNSDKLDDFYKRRACLPRNTKTLFYLMHAKIIEDKQGYFRIKDVINLTDRNKKSVYNSIASLERDGLIKKVEVTRRDSKLITTDVGLDFLRNNKINPEEIFFGRKI